MKTDHQLYKLFRTKPSWFSALTGIGLPHGSKGKSIVFKELELSSDLVFEPSKKTDPHYVAEFQFYFDHSCPVRHQTAINQLWGQLNSAKNCLLKSYHPRAVKGIAIFGSKNQIPVHQMSRFPDIQFFVIGDLLKNVCKTDPDSVLLDVLALIFTHKCRSLRC